MTSFLTRWTALFALAGAALVPAAAQAGDLEASFDQAYGTRAQRSPVAILPAPRTPVQSPVVQPTARPAAQAFAMPQAAARSYGSALEAQVAMLASAEQGRIGVAAVDLSSGRTVTVLGDQPFPLASTSKIAIVATFLQGVDDGRWRLTDQFPLRVPMPSAKFSGPAAPTRAGDMLSAQSLIELAITRSDNQATDALLAAVGGPAAVNRWMQQGGITGFRLDRTIATLVRDDGEVDPAYSIDPRDSASPLAMTRLLAGLYQGQFLSAPSRALLLGAMERCETGRGRLRAQLPDGAWIAHKTGTLSNTSSDVGIIRTPDGRAFAVAVYVTGQGSKASRDAKIATLARTIYDGYQAESSGNRRSASR